MITEIKNKTVPAALAVAVVVLASAMAARADQSACVEAKSYPLKKCVVDGKKLAKADMTYTVAREGWNVKLCDQTCATEFDQNSAKYLSKIKHAEKRASKGEQMASLPPALDRSPGGLAWAGW